MKKINNGFTLIELLAVIVILAIIALIATPIIINVIEKARKGAFEDTAYGVLDSLKLDYVERVANGTSAHTLKFLFPNNKLKLSGEKPAGGVAMINEKGKISFALNDKDKRWCALKNTDNEKVIMIDYNESKCKIDESIIILPTYSILPAGDVWARSKKVIITYPERENNYVYQYSINGGKSWETLESGLTKELIFNQNGTVIARIYNGKNYFNGSTLSVTKVDTVTPTDVSVSKVSSTGNSITVKANGTDSESGIGKYEFSKDNGSTWVNGGTNNTYTFIGLKPGNYQVKVRVTDRAGNSFISDVAEFSVGLVNGSVVYFDPEKGEKCNTYTEANSLNETKTGCMKWYIFQNNNSNKINLLLDHNTTYEIQYNSANDNTYGKEIYTKLREDTKGWTGNPRLISADEIAHITGNNSFYSGSTEIYYRFYFDTNTTTPSQNRGPGTSKYKWLFDYTWHCKEFGCSKEDQNTEGYWTSDRVYKNKINIWVVDYAGLLNYRNAVTPFGIRPVITVDKSIIS